jgi:putative oxidoreductase|tara:strand:- start:6281 stop:6700 length:420 start_codon:yes stop_codon:yes gene_type:complete
MYIGKYLGKYHDQFYVVFRILVGLLFFCHGAQKVLGWFTDKPAMALGSSMGIVGLAEIIGGLAILLGFWSRLAGSGGIVLMILAYFKAHFPGFVLGLELFPIVNRGELAVLYLACFLLVVQHGNGKLSLEKAVTKGELF